MRSASQHSFAQVPRANIPRSQFNRPHPIKTTLDADYLVPILMEDIIPGDTFNVDFSFLMELLSPTVVAVKDNLQVQSFFFFIPYRLVWENFEKFHGAQDNPTDTIDYTIPVIHTGAADISDITNGDYRTLLNYFGCPPGS